MVAEYIWWIAAAVLVGVEMMTGTFYLLIVSLACVVGGIVAVMGYDTGWQWGLAAAVEVLGTLAVVRWKQRFKSAPKLSNNLDIGQKVSVLTWNDDGTARVSYRGTQWDAVLDSAATPKREQMMIMETRGSRLVLGPVPG